MKLQAGDRIYLDEKEYADLISYSSFELSNRAGFFDRNERFDYFHDEIQEVLDEVICLDFCTCDWHHVVEQLYCEKAFPWQ